MSVQEFMAEYLVLGLLNGLVIYLVFYLMFQRLIASKTPEERTSVSTLMVMGGFQYDEPPRLSVTSMIRDVFKRALKASRLRGWSWLLTGSGKWYVLGLLALMALIIASVIYGW